MVVMAYHRSTSRVVRVMDMLGPSLWDGSEKLFWEHQKGGEGKGNHKMLSIQISYGLDK